MLQPNDLVLHSEDVHLVPSIANPFFSFIAKPGFLSNYENDALIGVEGEIDKVDSRHVDEISLHHVPVVDPIRNHSPFARVNAN